MLPNDLTRMDFDTDGYAGSTTPVSFTMAPPRARIDLIGRFRVTLAGRDVTPRGARARALLAILAQTPDLCRNRRWIETRLWSERGAQQASGSLRQVLLEIRKAFGRTEDILLSNRDAVWLNPDRIVIDTRDDAERARNDLERGRELLEGLTVADPAFEDWLHGEKLRVAHDLAPSARGPEAPQPACTLTVSVRDRMTPEQERATDLCRQFLSQHFEGGVTFETVDLLHTA